MAARKSANGSSATRVELALVREVFEEKFKPLERIPAAVGKLEVQQAVMVERLDNVATPDNCPITHQVEELQVAVRRASHEGNANTTFRIQTKAIFAVVIFAISTASGFIAVLLAHVIS
jgi:uncharacterized protein YjbK